MQNPIDPTSTRQRTHRWKFCRAGGIDQVCLETGADLLALDQLDQKLWVALSCPTRGLEFDARTLDLIDTDKDGRIRVPEILAAVRWTCTMLKDPGCLRECSDTLPLDRIQDGNPDGAKLLASARQILANLGKADAREVSLPDLEDTARIFAQTRFNGDGVIPASSAESEDTRNAIDDIIRIMGSTPDRSGFPGITQDRVDSFFEALQAFAGWWLLLEADRAGIEPLGAGTAEAFEALLAVRPKIDDFFARTRLATFDARAVAAMNRPESDLVALGIRELSADASEAVAFPLARIEPGASLPLSEGLNPAWAAPMEQFRRRVVAPLLGAETALLDGPSWNRIKAVFAPYETWRKARAGLNVESLGLERARTLLAGDARSEITRLIGEDKALEPVAAAIGDVEKLTRFHRHLHTLLNNFVAFSNFYSGQQKAIFQAGTLYLDGRSCELVLRVDDAPRHVAMAPLSRTFLAYCECTRKATGEKITIAAAFTDGDGDNLMVGRNGVFYDREGQDWDATITRVIDQPISIRQAFWAPYKKLVRMIEEQIAKRATAADSAATTHLGNAVTQVDKAAATGKPPEAKPKLDSGLIAALSVAAAGLGGAIGGAIGSFLNLGPLMPLGVLGIILLISGPSMVLAWLKLRQRNLGPLLDASGWAVNTRARINIPFGSALTRVAALPRNAERVLEDPYADRDQSSGWGGLIIILVLGLAAGYAVYSSNLNRVRNGSTGGEPKTAPAKAIP